MDLEFKKKVKKDVKGRICCGHDCWGEEYFEIKDNICLVLVAGGGIHRIQMYLYIEENGEIHREEIGKPPIPKRFLKTEEINDVINIVSRVLEIYRGEIELKNFEEGY